jgi:hypothetical protein
MDAFDELLREADAVLGPVPAVSAENPGAEDHQLYATTQGDTAVAIGAPGDPLGAVDPLTGAVALAESAPAPLVSPLLAPPVVATSPFSDSAFGQGTPMSARALFADLPSGPGSGASAAPSGVGAADPSGDSGSGTGSGGFGALGGSVGSGGAVAVDVFSSGGSAPTSSLFQTSLAPAAGLLGGGEDREAPAAPVAPALHVPSLGSAQEPVSAAADPLSLLSSVHVQATPLYAGGVALDGFGAGSAGSASEGASGGFAASDAFASGGSGAGSGAAHYLAMNASTQSIDLGSPSLGATRGTPCCSSPPPLLACTLG